MRTARLSINESMLWSLYYLFLTVALAAAEQTQDEAKLLEKCLLQISTRDNLEANLQKLTNYANWTAEEVPCLLRCLAHGKRWFDIEQSKWLKQRVVDDLGTDMYNYCRYELDREYRDACAYAYRGFRCLKQAELHAGATYITLLQCAKQLNASNEQLLEYTRLKPTEVVPCLFECFAHKMQFYTNDGEWQLANWIKAFGPIKHDRTDFKWCRLSAARRSQLSKCQWMYEEYVCWERFNENPYADKVASGDSAPVLAPTAAPTTTTTAESLRSILGSQANN